MKCFISIAAAVMTFTSAALAQYTNILENGSTQTVDMAWVADTVWIGGTTADNTMLVVNGGEITSSNVYVGASSLADYNTVSMTGTSRWDIAGQLIIGAGRSNTVEVTDGATLRAADLQLQSGNIMIIEGGGSVEGLVSMSVYSNTSILGQGIIGFGTNDASLAFIGREITLDQDLLFSADAGASNTLSFTDSELDVAAFDETRFLNFGSLELNNSDIVGTGLLNAFNDITMTGGSIDPAGTQAGLLELGGRFSSTDTVYRAQVQSAANDALVFSGSDPVDLSGLNLDLLVSGTTTGAVAILSAGGGLTNDFASADIISRPLLYTAGLLITNDEVRVILEVDDATEISSMLDYAAVESIRAGFSGMKNMVFTRTKQLRRNLVSTSDAIPNDVFLLTTTNAPAGALGPGDQNTIFDMHVWMQHYNGQGDYDGVGIMGPFTLNNNGTSFGIDKLVGDSLAVGLNYTYARSAAESGSGNQLDSETYWIGGYGEWVGREGLYVDALVAYGYNSFESERLAESYHGTASYNGHVFGAYADVGQYYYYGENLALSPYMGLHGLTMMTEAHDESEDAGSVVHIDEVDHSLLESSLGLKLRHRFDTGIGRFQTTGYAEWLYEFIQDDISSSMSSGGLASKQTERITPDDTGINVGLGYSWICTDYMEIGVGYNGRFSDNFEEHTGSVMFDIMF